MSEIRCVGGYLDNVMVPDRGAKMQVLDYLDYQKYANLPKGDPRLNDRVKYHTYTRFGTVYVHDENCCPTKELKDVR
ncbi:hypothetical protein HWB90_gp079 [Mycobacterium phage Fowlmouth]|uniref:Uncharacterized protein n=2 Tax=Fowlmouthvirus fowlmouth TaxID=2845652 RepID=A0A7G8LQ01_9CAUD|nr:hypothetical protein HWB90_gp079 [Mycobacterium phage Fowlmouth]AYN58060.1 hypothetical protein SEA_FOWLMOUTH_111 [Mycobacterium phage Fowlmouth]QNJ59323.1 hypothetical protein SEA_MRMIYAGI_110 [Mycobacterium phage MrMiyagi]